MWDEAHEVSLSAFSTSRTAQTMYASLTLSRALTLRGILEIADAQRRSATGAGAERFDQRIIDVAQVGIDLAVGPAIKLREVQSQSVRLAGGTLFQVKRDCPESVHSSLVHFRSEMGIRKNGEKTQRYLRVQCHGLD